MANSSLLEELLEQERTLVFDEFDNDAAIGLGTLLVAMAKERKLSITTDITRSGQQLFHAALKGTSADNDHWVQRKVAVVMRFAHSSFYMGRLCVETGVDFHTKYALDPRSYAPSGGAFPIAVKGAGMIGAVAVSGLPQADDHALVVEALRNVLAKR